MYAFNINRVVYMYIHLAWLFRQLMSNIIHMKIGHVHVYLLFGPFVHQCCHLISLLIADILYNNLTFPCDNFIAIMNIKFGIQHATVYTCVVILLLFS